MKEHSTIYPQAVEQSMLKRRVDAPHEIDQIAQEIQTHVETKRSLYPNFTLNQCYSIPLPRSLV